MLLLRLSFEAGLPLENITDVKQEQNGSYDCDSDEAVARVSILLMVDHSTDELGSGFFPHRSKTGPPDILHHGLVKTVSAEVMNGGPNGFT